MRMLAMIAAVLSVLALGAQAQESRFQLERSGDGFLRLDRQTGAISRCSDQDGEVVCRSSDDDLAASANELGRLEDRIEALEGRIAALENERPQASGNLPSEEEFEQSLGLMERFMRRFFGIIQDFERQISPEEQEPMPDRT